MKDNKTKLWKTLKIIFSIWILSFLVSSFFSFNTEFDIAGGNVAIIPITDIILTSSGGFNNPATSSETVISFLDQAQNNPNIKAILLDINSPGGSGVAADEIGQKIKEINKPTIAVIREMGASAAYWIASSSDYIFANRLSLTASIGVIGSYLDFSELIEEYNVSYQRYVSGELKDMISPFKEDTPKEERLFQEIIDQSHEFFIMEVAQNRNMSKEEIRKLADGRIMLGSQAFEAGLVDELGTKQDAIKYIESSLNITAVTVEYKEKVSITELLYGFTSSKGGKFINSNIPIQFK
ncbi:signal peptide peptidase SppA [archaeon]|jgi:protease-4|nr:signal peptide peptidase SppA [archaeon]MBT3721066.1 signal peptide peptidase SppA [archaeon]MBT4023167.1 signal peptide peptidase SppA [archaeon]MBT4272373.1 signal peptide peptidase SppA [archaeon]MBT4460718.1 signal peptide peptidase SppA [archaeon]